MAKGKGEAKGGLQPSSPDRLNPNPDVNPRLVTVRLIKFSSLWMLPQMEKYTPELSENKGELKPHNRADLHMQTHEPSQLSLFSVLPQTSPPLPVQTQQQQMNMLPETLVHYKTCLCQGLVAMIHRTNVLPLWYILHTVTISEAHQRLNVMEHSHLLIYVISSSYTTSSIH